MVCYIWRAITSAWRRIAKNDVMIDIRFFWWKARGVGWTSNSVLRQSKGTCRSISDRGFLAFHYYYYSSSLVFIYNLGTGQTLQLGVLELEEWIYGNERCVLYVNDDLHIHWQGLSLRELPLMDLLCKFEIIVELSVTPVGALPNSRRKQSVPARIRWIRNHNDYVIVNIMS